MCGCRKMYYRLLGKWIKNWTKTRMLVTSMVLCCLLVFCIGMGFLKKGSELNTFITFIVLSAAFVWSTGKYFEYPRFELAYEQDKLLSSSITLSTRDCDFSILYPDTRYTLIYEDLQTHKKQKFPNG
eukprot:TRINITY_DN4170_c0_g1_i1.p2 TRINITY_DN4170_c0_g1~~TRINITY_DN4170_c0_g1_i1.p2  ORF type:complete len:127 (-),score=3.36 TRINITY_DN4170_c0_g1_i1:277-657(-)